MPEAKNNTNAAQARLLALLKQSIAGKALKQEFGLLFSGGIDSLLLAALCREKGLKFTCFYGYVDGVGKPKGLEFARKAAKALNLKLETASICLEKLPALIKELVPIVGASPVSIGIAIPLFLACGKAQKAGFKTVLSGQGADELFYGYARFKDCGNVRAEALNALQKLKQQDLRWNRAIAQARNLKLVTPYLDSRIESFALSLSKESKISKSRNKIVLRDLALFLGLGPEFAERKKLAAQYCSNADKAIGKLAKKAGKSKSEYLSGFESKRIAALFSGGKDSCFSLWRMQQQGHRIECLVSIIPKSRDSFMYHKPELSFLRLQSKALGISLLVEKTSAGKEKELVAISLALKRAKKEFGVEGVVSGALYSEYQRKRIQKICDSLNLELFSPLWHIKQEEELRKLVESGFEFVISKIAALGLGSKWLGRRVGEKEIAELEALNKKIGFNVAGEGGEFESLVLSAPNFNGRIKIVKAKKVMQNEFTGFLEIKKAVLEKKG